MFRVQLGITLLLLLHALASWSQVSVTPIDAVVNNVKVREHPSTLDTRVVGVLAPGQSATVLESVAHWYQIRLPGDVNGFVSKRWVRVIAAPTAEMPALGVPFALHVADVGNGDGIILDMGTSEIVFDGGMPSKRFAEYALGKALIQDPIELALVTHADTDHWRGMEGLLAQSGFRVDEFWEPGFDRDCKPLDSYQAFIARMRSHVPTERYKRPLQAFHTPADVSAQPTWFSLPNLTGVEFLLLHSDSAPEGSDCAYRINNASIVLKVRVGGVTLLLAGDANGKERDQSGDITPSHVEAKLLELEAQHPGILRADVLKVAHHGSETANTAQFLAAVKPRFALISASTSHHLPRPTVIRRLEATGAIVLTTDISRQPGNDPLLCVGTGDGEVDCNYADQID